MLRLKRALGAWILASAFLPTVAAHTATYYVATTGSNSNPGTQSNPWKTVAHAVNTMVAGDTTYVRGGVYNEGLIRFKKSGTAAAPIKLLNYPGESPIIDFRDKTAFHRILVSHASGTNVAMGWITIQGFEIRNGYDGIKFYNLHDSVIQLNWIHDSLTNGIFGGGGHHNIFDRNIINHNGNFTECARTGLPTPCKSQHGIYAHGDAYTIINNLIYDNIAFGIQQNGSSTSTYKAVRHAGPEFSGAKNWIIAHNTIAYEQNAPGLVVWGGACLSYDCQQHFF